MEEIKKHSDIGASTCERWWNCPGSVALIKKAPPRELNKAAAEGTAAHELAEWALRLVKKGITPNLHAEIGQTKMVENIQGYDDFEIEITEEMVEAVVVYLEDIAVDAARFGTGYSFLSIEEQFHLDIDKEAWGRNDAFLYKPFQTLYLWDFKYGKGVVVEAENNKQLMYYALGAMKGRDIKEAVTYIVQPRAYHPDGAVRKCVYSVIELCAFEANLETHIKNTREPNAPLHAGEHCKFCPAIVICPEIKKETHEVAKRDFAEVSTLPIDTMIKLAEMQPRIIDFLKEVVKHLQAKAERGAEVPGFKLVKARSTRVWKSEQRVINDFRKQLGDLMLSPSKLLSPAQMEKKCKELLEKDVLLPYIDKPDAGLTLVKDSDPRQAVKSSASKDFKNIL